MGSSQSKSNNSADKTIVNKALQFEPTSNFELLSNDIIIEILSYISNAPFENDITNAKSTLTHVLPFVSKQFQKLCQNDTLWLQSFQRLIGNNPEYWKYSLSMLLEAGIRTPPWSQLYNQKVDRNVYMLASKVSTMDTMCKIDFDNLMMDIYDSVQSKIIDDMEKYNTIAAADRNYKHDVKSFYLTFVINYIQISLPVFYTSYRNLIKGMIVNVILYENEHRSLISYIMLGRKRMSLKSQTMKYPRPRFIFAHGSKSRGSKAHLVEVCNYSQLPGGRVQVGILILNHVNLLEVHERYDTNLGSQIDAQIKRFC